MSWHCPTCGGEHLRQYDAPTRCSACEVAERYEARIAELNEECSRLLARVCELEDQVAVAKGLGYALGFEDGYAKGRAHEPKADTVECRCLACGRFVRPEQIRPVSFTWEGRTQDLTPHCTYCLPPKEGGQP